MRRIAFVTLAASLALAACDATDPPLPAPTIQFRLDAPLCSGVYTVSFATEDSSFGSHAYRVLGNAPDSMSRTYVMEPGQHVISASMDVLPGNPNTWPDTTMTFASGDAHVRVLELYCS